MNFPFIILIQITLLSSFSFGQTKQEQLIDSVLVSCVSKTYEQYIDCVRQKEKKIKPSATEMEALYKKNGIYPSFSTMYYSKECPLIIVKKQNQLLGAAIYPSLKVDFEKIKKVSFLENPRATALYGSQGEFGVYIIEVE